MNYDDLEFEEITGIQKNITWKPEEPGDYITGKYLRSEAGKGKGEGLIFHIIEDSQGQEVSILGRAVLNKKMELVEPGDIIRILFNGISKNQKGREYYDYALYGAVKE